MSVKVTVKNNGPILIDGCFELLDQSAAQFNIEDKKVIALCRCGHSANQPFCDGAHKKSEFKSEITAR